MLQCLCFLFFCSNICASPEMFNHFITFDVQMFTNWVKYHKRTFAKRHTSDYFKPTYLVLFHLFLYFYSLLLLLLLFWEDKRMTLCNTNVKNYTKKDRISHRSWNLITIGSISAAWTFTTEVVAMIDASVTIRTWIICTEIHLKCHFFRDLSKKFLC